MLTAAKRWPDLTVLGAEMVAIATPGTLGTTLGSLISQAVVDAGFGAA